MAVAACPRRWLATVLAALLAIGWQSFVTQAHVHPQPAGMASSALAGGGEARLQAKAPPADTPATCPICRELAQSGRYISPGPLAWHAPESASHRAFVPFVRRRDVPARSHAWNSRGPPALRLA